MNSTQLRHAAAGRLRRDGWCQGSFRLPPGECCILGALRMEAFGVVDHNRIMGENEPAYRVAIYKLHRALGPLTTISGWNDVSGRTAEQVIALLEKAEVQS